MTGLLYLCGRELFWFKESTFYN